MYLFHGLSEDLEIQFQKCLYKSKLIYQFIFYEDFEIPSYISAYKLATKIRKPVQRVMCVQNVL